MLNLRLLDEIDADTFGVKNTELRDRIAAFGTQLDATDRGREETVGVKNKPTCR